MPIRQLTLSGLLLTAFLPGAAAMIPDAPAANWTRMTGESRGSICAVVPDIRPVPEPWQTSGNAFHFAGANSSAGWNLFAAEPGPVVELRTRHGNLQTQAVAVTEVESWIAAALAGAFGAFWLNRQIMEGVPQKPSPQF